MIKVTFKKNDNEFSMNVDGHANSEEKGKDLVCASASMLATTLAVDVFQCENAELFSEKAYITLDDGKAEIVCKCKDDLAVAYVRRAFLLIIEGFKLLADSYPEYAELELIGF